MQKREEEEMKEKQFPSSLLAKQNVPYRHRGRDEERGQNEMKTKFPPPPPLLFLYGRDAASSLPSPC